MAFRWGFAASKTVFVIFCGAEDGTVGDAGHIGVVDRSQVDIT
ncbi:hypothetical protein [Anaplasma marginale]|nr:hypothetical protein [Anaplasma marginale]